MIAKEMCAVIELIDLIAPKLRGSDHSRRLAILRAQLLALTREVEREACKIAPALVLSDTAPPRNDLVRTKRLQNT
jgi:hypothetical protein